MPSHTPEEQTKSKLTRAAKRDGTIVFLNKAGEEVTPFDAEENVIKRSKARLDELNRIRRKKALQKLFGGSPK